MKNKTFKTILLVAMGLMLIATPVFSETFRQGGDRFTFNPSNIVTKTAAYTLTSSDSLVNVTTSSANITITLPTVSSASSSGSKTYKILKTDATAYTVVVTPASGDTIGGESTRYLTYQNAYVVISTGPNNDWVVDFESPYLVENYETGAITLNGSLTQFGDVVVSGTTPSVTVGDGGEEDTMVLFDANPALADMHIGYDDSADMLRIGVGSALGTDHRISIANTLDSTTIIIGDAAAEDSMIKFDGNAQDFHVGLDDSADKLVIGLGGTLGTTQRLTFNSADLSILVGDATAADVAFIFDGNAQDFYVGIDDSADDLVFGKGSALGTTLALSIDENMVVSIANSVVYPQETVTATNVITNQECGRTFILSSATEFDSTLPTASTVSAGCKFTFIIGAAPSGAAYNVKTGNTLENTFYGTVYNGVGFDTQAAGDTVTFTDGAALVGDMLEVFADGTNYFIKGNSGANTGISIAQAD